MTVRSLPVYFLLAFGIAWGVFALFILAPEQVTAVFGPVSARNPLFFLAVWSPAISAFILVLASGGVGGLRRYLSRLALWRAPAPWYLFLLFGMPAR